jgi:hypothetical protein
VSLGNALRKPATRTGAVAGLVAGVGLGFALSGRDGHRSAWGTAIWTAPALAVVGAGTGAFLGHGPNEQWRTIIPPPQPTGLALGHNVSVSIRLGF